MARRLEHILLLVPRCLLHNHMYKENEIAKARLALLKHTNMVSYAADEYKRVYGTEAPAGVCRYVVLG